MKEIDILKDIVRSKGIITEQEFMSKKSNRVRLHSTNPKSFLAVGKNGTPRFPIVNQYNAVSMSTLKRSLAAARRQRSIAQNKSKYQKIIDKLKVYINRIEKRTNTYPVSYKIDNALKNILNKGMKKTLIKIGE